MNRISPLMILAILTMGCGISEEKFNEKYAEAYCEWLENCGKLSEQFGTPETCITNREIFADEVLSPEECTYDKVSAKDCIKDIEDNESCDVTSPLPDSCQDIASCDGDTGQ
ncbi:MAG: hypothetical protein ACPGTU_08840 [Myxococcota bacterium]